MDLEHVFVLLAAVHVTGYMLLGKLLMDEMRDYEDVRITHWAAHMEMVAGLAFNMTISFTAAVEADMCQLTLALSSFFLLLQLCSQRLKTLYALFRANRWNSAWTQPILWMACAFAIALGGALLIHFTRDRVLQDCMDALDVCYTAMHLSVNYVLFGLNTVMCIIEFACVERNKLYLRTEIICVNTVQTVCLAIAVGFYNAAAHEPTQCVVAFLSAERIVLTILSMSSLLVGVLPFVTLRWPAWRSEAQKRLFRYNIVDNNEEQMQTLSTPGMSVSSVMAALAENSDQCLAQGHVVSKLNVWLNEQTIDEMLLMHHQFCTRVCAAKAQTHLKCYNKIREFCRTEFKTEAVRTHKAGELLQQVLSELQSDTNYPLPESFPIDTARPVKTLLQLLGFGSLVLMHAIEEENTRLYDET